MWKSMMVSLLAAGVIVGFGNVTEAGLVGHWMMDGATGATITDSITPADIYTQGGSKTRVAGQLGNALATLGANNDAYLTTKTFGGMTTGFTAMGWVKYGPALLFSNESLLRDRNAQDGVDSNVGFDFGLASVSGQGRINLELGIGGVWQGGMWSAPAVTVAGEWVHIAAVYDSTNTAQEVTYYRNGASFGGANIANGIFAEGAGNFAVLGRRYQGVGSGVGAGAFTGAADDFALYNQVLTAEQINNAMTLGAQNFAGVPEPSTLALGILGLTALARRRVRLPAAC